MLQHASEDGAQEHKDVRHVPHADEGGGTLTRLQMVVASRGTDMSDSPLGATEGRFGSQTLQTPARPEKLLLIAEKTSREGRKWKMTQTAGISIMTDSFPEEPHLSRLPVGRCI
jgi:hypothetical protein